MDEETATNNQASHASLRPHELVSNVGSSYAELHDVLHRSKQIQAVKIKAMNKSSMASSPRRATTENAGDTMSTQRNNMELGGGGSTVMSRRVKN